VRIGRTREGKQKTWVTGRQAKKKGVREDKRKKLGHIIKTELGVKLGEGGGGW